MPKKTKTANTELIDYRKEVLALLNKNASAATKAGGLKAVNLILKQMDEDI